MAKLTPEDQELRLRLCAHIRRIYAERRFKHRQDMAEKLDMDPGHFSALYNGKAEIGLDFTVQLHRVFGESLNHLCDDDPPASFYPPGMPPGFYAARDPVPRAAETQAPYSASPSTAEPGKPRRTAGRHKHAR